MPLDPSIALNANAPQPTNPLQTALQVAQYRSANAMGQAQQQQLAANRATSAAYQSAIDPVTGQLDTNKLSVALGRNPDAAYNYADTMAKVQAQKQAQQTYDRGAVGLNNDQLDNAKNHLNWAYQTASAVANNPNASTDDVFNAISQSVKNGQITPQIASQAIADMPGPGSPPGALQRWAANHAAQAAGAASQLGLAQPTLGTMDTGGAINTTATDKLSGVQTVTGTTPKTFTPGEASSQVPIVQPNGAQGTISKAAVAQAQGQGNLVGGAPGAQPSPIGNGRYPSGGAAPSAPAAPGGVLPTGLAPGVADAATVAGQGSGKQMLEDQQANAGSGQRVYQLQAALKGLQGAGSTGPGTAEVNNAKSFLLAQSPDWMKNHLPGIDPNKIASYDEANKYLTQYASAKASSLGSGTDSKLATTLSGNASTHISGLAAQDVVKANIGLERMGQAQQDAFQQSGLPAAEYSKWASKFGSTLDPRVFIADQMDPAKVKGMYDKMQPKEQAQFRTQYNWAVQKGYLNGPQ